MVVEDVESLCKVWEFILHDLSRGAGDGNGSLLALFECAQWIQTFKE